MGKTILPDVWAVPERFRERVGVRAGRQRVMLHDGHALLLLHQLPAEGERDRKPAIFWRDPEGSWRCSPGRDGIASLRTHLDAYVERVEQLDDRSENATGASEYFAVLRAARPVQRAARNMHAALQQLRDAVPNDADVLAMRDRAYELERNADLVVEDAHGGMEFTIAQRAEEQARVSEKIAIESHRLNLLAAVCLPVTALGAMLGVNMRSGLETLPQPLAFWIFVAAAFALGVVLRTQVQRAK